MNTKQFLTLTLLTFALCATVIGDDRSWTDVKGRKIEAEFLREEGSYVVLAKGDKIMRIAFATLSEADQMFIKSLRAKNEIAPVAEPSKEEEAFGGGTSGSLAKPETMDAPITKTPAKEKDTTPVQAGLGEMRLWTTNDGSSLRAKFVQVKENMVILRTGIKNQTVLFISLSLPDQEYVKGMLRGRKQDLLIVQLEREVELAKNPRNAAGGIGSGSFSSLPTGGSELANTPNIGASSGPSYGSSLGSSPSSFNPRAGLRGSNPDLGSYPAGGFPSGSSSTGVVMPSSPTYGSSVTSPPGYGSSPPGGYTSSGPSYTPPPNGAYPGQTPYVPAVPVPSGTSSGASSGENYKSTSGLYGSSSPPNRNLLFELGVTGYMLAGSFVALCIALVATVLKVMVAGK